MQDYEDMLLKKLMNLTSKVEKAKTLEDKLVIFANRRNDSDKYFLLSLTGFLDKNEFTKGIKKFRYDIFKLLYNAFNTKKRDHEFYLRYIQKDADDEFKKIMYISFFIGRNKYLRFYSILSWILDEKKFQNLGKLEITEISSQELFIKKILNNKIEDLEKEAKNSQKNYNYNQFLEITNEELIDYFNQDDKNNKKSEKINDNDNDIGNDSKNDFENKTGIDIDIANTEKNDLNKNSQNDVAINEENINVIEEEINKINIIDEEKEKNKEKINRIKQLICKNLLINDNKDFPHLSVLESNYEKICEIKEPIKFGDILIDDYEFKDESKFYLFSPISLIMNNMKTKFEKNDFEIFNFDNYYIELFGKYLELIINKLNNYINEGTEKDFIEKNKIKFGCYNKHFYLCCKLNHDFKEQYFNQIELNKSRYNKDNQKIEIIKIKNIEEEKEIITQKAKDEAKKLYTTFSSIKTAKNNYNRKVANSLENTVSKFLIDKDCEDLQNLILFFNLKIPKIENEKIIFNSFRLSFSQILNNLYGFREIDICFKNSNERILDGDILLNNLCYQSDQSTFKKKKNEQIDVSLNSDSIIFCEVKNAFGSITYGNQKCSKIQIEESKENEGKEEDEEDEENSNVTLTYMDQLENLMKKAKLFYDFFLKEKIIKEKKTMHVIYLYDEDNIDYLTSESKNIENSINGFILNLRLPPKWNNFIFQIAYFDKLKYEKNKEQRLEDKIKELEEEGQRKEDKIKELEEELSKMRNINKK